MRHECPPLPFLYAASNPTVRNGTLQLFPREGFSQVNLEKVAETVLKSPEVKSLARRLQRKVFRQIRELSFIENRKIEEELATLLLAQLYSLRCSVH